MRTSPLPTKVRKGGFFPWSFDAGRAFVRWRAKSFGASAWARARMVARASASKACSISASTSPSSVCRASASRSRPSAIGLPSRRRRALRNMPSTCARGESAGSSGTSTRASSPVDQSLPTRTREPRGARAAAGTSQAAPLAKISASSIFARSPRIAAARRNARDAAFATEARRAARSSSMRGSCASSFPVCGKSLSFQA